MSATGNCTSENPTRASSLVQTFLVWENDYCMPFQQCRRVDAAAIPIPTVAGFGVVRINVGDTDIPLEGLICAAPAYRAWLGERLGEYAIVATATDIEGTGKCGRLAVCFDIERAFARGTELSLIQMFYDLGRLVAADGV